MARQTIGRVAEAALRVMQKRMEFNDRVNREYDSKFTTKWRFDEVVKTEIAMPDEPAPVARLDVLYGVKVLQPSLSCRITSDGPIYPVSTNPLVDLIVRLLSD